MAIFGVKQTGKPSRMFRAGEATATFGPVSAILVQVQAQVQRNLQPIPTLNAGIIWAAQPVQGSLTAQTIIASDSKITEIANDACKKISATIDFGSTECKDGSEANSGVKLTINDGYCTSISFTASGSQGYIGSDLQLFFTNAELN